MQELLDTLLAIVGEKRINAGQEAEMWKRRGNDALGPSFRSDAFRQMDLHLDLESRYKALLAEMEAVICEELGDKWREAV